MHSEVIKYYLKKVNSMASISELRLIGSYIEDMEEALVLQAINIALEKDKANIRYIKAILDRWLDDNITTLSEYKKGVDNIGRFKSNERSFKKKYGKKI